MPRGSSFIPGTDPLSLLHIHLPRLINYTTALSLQSTLLSLHWTHRTHLKRTAPLASTDPSTNPSEPHTPNATRNITAPPPPPPILLTFSTNPTYTVGRRHLSANPLSPTQIAFLTRDDRAAHFHASSRGGLLTYHGPGQLTGFPLVDLRRFGISARCYVRMLEDAVVRTCDGVLAQGPGKGGEATRGRTGRSETDPGVWMLDDGGGATVSDRKVCALGVQVSRGVACYGVGLNVRDEPIVDPAEREAFTFDDHTPAAGDGQSDADTQPRGYLSWGFGRIVACGLEGKRTTWLTREGAPADTTTVGSVAERLADELVRGINRMGNGKETVHGVHTLVVGDREVEGLEEGSLHIKELFPD